MKGRTDQTLHEVLRQIPYGLYVVGVRNKENEINATVVSWAMQCSFFPPLIAVAIRKPSHTYDLIKDGKAFTLNFIDKDDDEIIRRLVRPADVVGDKLGQIGHVEEDTGAPILRKAFAYIECRLRSVEEPGDHAILFGEVIRAVARGEGEPLTCRDLGWHYGG